MKRRAVVKGLIGLILFLSAERVIGDELFPVGAELQKRVDFWIKIYTQYSKEELVLHDADHLEVIYDVVNVHDYFYESLTRRGRRRYLASVTEDFRTILAKLAELKEPLDVTTLSEKELFVYNLWSGIQQPDRFKKAKDNIHAQAGLRSLYQTGLQRSGRYLEEIKRVFRSYDLPEDLAYLPHVESAYNHRAYSKVGAAGMWQFTHSTGRLYLRISYGIDERYDPLISTDAAARLLRHNFDELGSWPLALTAYNHGAGGMQRAKNLLQTDDLEEIIKRYDGRAFGFASKNFYAEFLAAVEVAKNYQRYFGDIAFEKPDSFTVVKVPSQMMLDALARQFTVEKQTIARLNPALRPPILRSQRRIPKGYAIRLPIQTDIAPAAQLAQATAVDLIEAQVAETTYVVERGDNLSIIARSVGVSVEEIMDLNDLSNPRRLQVGQVLRLPATGKAREGDPANRPSPQEAVMDSLVRSEPVVVFPVDSAAQLLTRARHHAPAATIYGPVPPITSAAADTFVLSFAEPQNDVIIVQSEETIGHIADWLGITPQKLRGLNELRPHDNVQVGKKLKVDFSRVSQKIFHQRRIEYHRSLQEGFFANYKVQGVRNYTIRSGDSIWDLCNRRFDLPYWLLVRYNQEVNLMQLHPGVEIRVPIIAPAIEEPHANPEA